MHRRWLSGLQFQHAAHYIVLEDCIGDVLTLAAIVLDRHRSGSYQVPDRLVCLVRDPHCRQFTGTQ